MEQGAMGEGDEQRPSSHLISLSRTRMLRFTQPKTKTRSRLTDPQTNPSTFRPTMITGAERIAPSTLPSWRPNVAGIHSAKTIRRQAKNKIRKPQPKGRRPRGVAGCALDRQRKKKIVCSHSPEASLGTPTVRMRF